ncbi:MAG TPA: hypothetical protein VL728_05740 [Cyclobacteriaceae bacterium]|jgi:hypothetical protein|nr:hypothetical protein [Cyclobacteriaceae bacterium]
MRYTYLLLLLLAASALHAQRMKYKELFPLMSSMSDNEIKHSLKEFLAEELDHPNANFKLALMYEKSYRTTDGLTNYDYVMANAAQAKLRFVKAKQLVDEREVNRNNEYYAPTFKMVDAKGKPEVPFAVVATKIKNGYDSADLFISRMPAIYKAFTKSVNFYDKSVKNFSEINSRFSSLDDLYLYFDSDLDQQLETLKTSYDSTRFYLDQYLSLIKAYPIWHHKQQYTVKPIITYRMDGLVTTLNFLTDKIEIWDYSSWVEFIRKSVHTSISSLRNNLNLAEEKLDNSLAEIEKSGATKAPVKLDKQLVFNLNNFDKQSLALALLEYKAFKQGWLGQLKSFNPDTAFSDRNAEAYGSVIYANRNADTLAREITARTTKEKIGKHKEFFSKYYGSNEGVKGYVTQEKETLDRTFKDYSAKLRSEVIGLATHEPAAAGGKPVRFGKWNIPTQTTAFSRELLNKGETITLFSKASPDGSTFLSGVYKIDKKVKFFAAFLARIGPDGKPSWMKSFEYKKDSLSKIPDVNNLLAAVELTREGCAALVRTSDTLQTYQVNTFIYFNDKGEEKIKHKLKENGYPRKLNYVEKTNSFVLALKGLEAKNNFESSEGLVLLSLNALGDLQWSRTIEVAGSFTDLINLTDGNLLVGNFMILKDASGREYRTQISVKESNPFVAVISDKGDVSKIQPIQTSKSIFVSKAVKVGDMSINLLGSESTFGSPESEVFAPGEKTVHIMVNKNGLNICSNL